MWPNSFDEIRLNNGKYFSINFLMKINEELEQIINKRNGGYYRARLQIHSMAVVVVVLWGYF